MSRGAAHEERTAKQGRGAELGSPCPYRYSGHGCKRAGLGQELDSLHTVKIDKNKTELPSGVKSTTLGKLRSRERLDGPKLISQKRV